MNEHHRPCTQETLGPALLDLTSAIKALIPELQLLRKAMTDLKDEATALAADEQANTAALGNLVTAIGTIQANQAQAIATAVQTALAAAQQDNADATTILQGVDTAIQAATTQANNEIAALTPAPAPAPEPAPEPEAGS